MLAELPVALSFSLAGQLNVMGCPPEPLVWRDHTTRVSDRSVCGRLTRCQYMPNTHSSGAHDFCPHAHLLLSNRSSCSRSAAECDHNVSAGTVIHWVVFGDGWAYFLRNAALATERLDKYSRQLLTGAHESLANCSQRGQRQLSRDASARSSIAVTMVLLLRILLTTRGIARKVIWS